MRLASFFRFLARWCIRLILLLVFVGLPAMLIYLREYGIGFGLQDRVAAALSGDAFHTSIGKLAFDPFNGLVAEDVTIDETKGEQRNLAKIKKLVVSLNLSDLIARKISIDRIECDDTDVSVPVTMAPGSPRVSVRGVNAQLLFQPEQMRISYFEGNLEGLRVSLSGLFQNPQALRLRREPVRPHGSSGHQPVSNVLERIAELKFPGRPPELHVELTGDLADLSTLKVISASLSSGPIVAPKWRVEAVSANAAYESGVLDVDQLVIRSKTGELSGSAQFQSGILDFELSSSLGPEPFLELSSPDSPLRQLSFTHPPQLDIQGTLNFSQPVPDYQATGSLHVGGFQFKGVSFSHLMGDFACQNGKVYARNVRLGAGGGELSANVLYASDDFRLKMANTIIPTELAPLFGHNEREFLKLMDFRDRPYLQVSAQGSKPDLADITGAGYIKLGRTALRGSWLDWGESNLEFANKAVTYRNFWLGRGQGMGSGTFVYDFGGRQVRLDGVTSTMMPVDVMMWIDPRIAETIKPYQFHAPPRVKVQGMVHLSDPTKNNLMLNIQANDGMDYDLLKRTLHFGKVLADVGVIGTKVQANIKSAQLMGGDVGVKATVSIIPSDPTFGANVEVRRVNFADLTKLYFNYDDSDGVASGHFNFKARMGHEESMKGDGDLRVEKGHVFAIPILGPLSEIINKIIPGAGFETASLATATFTVGDGKIGTKDLTIDGAGFSLLGSGDIYFLTDKMNMSVRINARGIPGIVLFPVSKLFEYVSTGTVSKPEWRPKIIPRFGSGESKTPAANGSAPSSQ